MNTTGQFGITLRAWTLNDLSLLERLLGDPVMTKHIGGPETREQIRKRLERYCTDPKIHMFVIILESESVGIGSVGYWQREWQGQPVWESGWRILPEYQGKGIATRALALIIERTRAEQQHRFIHAFPSIDNAASNAICKTAGFVLQNEIDFEYPPGTGRFMCSNDWRLDLKPEG